MECTECGVTCYPSLAFERATREGLEREGVGRSMHDFLPIAKYALPIEQCPTREIIQERRRQAGEGLWGWAKWQIQKRSVIEEAIGQMDEPMSVDPVSILVLKSRIPPYFPY